MDIYKKQVRELIPLYRHQLYDDVIPFWQKFSIDYEYGGFFTCLDREGVVFVRDKFIILKFRQVLKNYKI